ncbi:MAG: GumC family protein [Flavobacteriales bacterium]
MEGSQPTDQFPEEKEFDLRSFLRYYVRYWPLFLFVLGLSLSAAYFYNWYATRIYRSTAKVLIKEEDSQKGQRKLLKELDINAEDQNIKNEIEVLKSRKLALRVIDSLEFRTSYFLVGNIKVSEVYKRSPVKVVPDTLSFFSYINEFHLRILDPTHYRLSYETKKGESYEQKFRFGETVKNRMGELRIRKRKGVFKDSLFQDPSYDKRHYKLHFHSRNSIANRYRHKLKVEIARPGSSILKLILEDPVPHKAADFLNTLIEAYQEHNVRMKNRMAENTDRFIEKRLKVIEKDLEKIEAERESFKMKNKITNIKTEGKMVLEEIEKLDRKLTLLRSKLSTIEHIQKSLQGEELTQISPSTLDITDPLLNKLVKELHELERKKTELEFRIKKNNPQKNALEKEIAKTRASLRKNLQNIRENLLARKEELRTRLAEKQKRLKNIPRKQQQLVKIQRQYRIQEKLYSYLLEKKAETQISLESSVSSNRIIERARPTPSRVSPVAMRTYSVALILGLFFPVLLVYLREKIDDRIMSIPTIERLTSIPVIGVIGFHRSEEKIAVLRNPRAAITEAFRSLRTKLEGALKEDQKGARTFLVTSSIGTEGKTFTSINLATVFALSGKRTILIGGDLRKPRLTDSFNIPNERGISTYLDDPEEDLDAIIMNSEVHESLEILPAGPTPPDPAESIITDRMEEMMRALKERYDRIVIDTPPIGLVTDGIIMTRYSDANIFVVRQALTRKPNIVQLNEVHRKHDLHRFTILFNAVKASKGGYGYGYGYGYGHGYGYGYGYYAEEEKEGKKGLTSFFRKRS